jgi:hypothetical protein
VRHVPEQFCLARTSEQEDGLGNQVTKNAAYIKNKLGIINDFKSFNFKYKE